MKYINILIALIIMMGCSNGNLNYVIEEVNGIKVYKNRNIPANKDLRIEIKELFTIKGDTENYEADSLRMFQDINSIDLDSDGNIYILSMKKAEIKKFDTNGVFVKSFGRMGDGPGETKWPQAMYVQNDTVYVLNQTVLQMVKYDTDGNFITNVSTKECKMPVYIEKVGNRKLLTYLCNWRTEDEGLFMDYDLGLVSSDFELGTIFIKQSFSRETIMAGKADIIYGKTVSGKEIFIADNGVNNYKISVYDFEGNSTYNIEKSFAKVRVNDEEKTKKGTSSFEEVYKPAIYDLISDNKGRIWTFVSEEKNGENKNDIVVDIFKGGIFLNRTKLDMSDVSIQFAKGNRLYCIDYDEMTLKVYEYQVIE